MPAHELEVLRQGLWASLTGGWYYDPHADFFANTFHTYTWLLFLCLPLGLHLLLPPGAFVVYGLGIYCSFIFVFFSVLNLVNYRLHKMFDTSQVQEDSASEEEDEDDIDDEEEDETSELGAVGGVAKDALDDIEAAAGNNGGNEKSSIRKSSSKTRNGDGNQGAIYANVNATRRRKRSSRRRNNNKTHGATSGINGGVVEDDGIEMRRIVGGRERGVDDDFATVLSPTITTVRFVG